MVIPLAFETVEYIAHLNLRDEHLPYKRIIAKVVLDKNRPKIQTIVNKIDAISSDYQTMSLEVLAGNRSLVITVVESGIKFHVDLEAVYVLFYQIDENVQREIINVKSLMLPNIIRFKEVFLTPFAIVVEYAAGGEIFSRISTAGRFCEDKNRLVVLITNVKPGKLRDVVSEGLDHTKVEPFLPLEGAKPGEAVSISGNDGKPEDVLNLK